MKPVHVTPIVVVLVVLLAAASGLAEEPASSLPDGPDFKDVLSLQSVGGPRISPDGSAVVYSVRGADWEENRYDSELWLARGDEEPFQLTRTADGGSSQLRRLPDGGRDRRA